jgi:hypothetical protein
MNLDELKTTWQTYDKKLTATRQLNEKLIKNIIREKSGTALSRMRRNCLLIILWMIVIICFCISSIIYTIYYQYHFQYLSLIVFVVVGGIYIFQLIKEYRNSNIDLYNNNLKASLVNTLEVHEKLMSTNKKVPLLFLLAGFLYLVNSSIKAFHNEGIVHAVIFLTAGLLTNALIFFVAHKMGAFKDHFGIRLKNQLKELEEFEEEGVNF